MSVQGKRHSLRIVLATAATFALASPVLAQQTQWNEVPAPTGKEAVSRTYPAGYRTDVIDVPLAAGVELEYMVAMKAGGTVVYSWEVPTIAHPGFFFTEFHGHTEPVGGKGDVMFYQKGSGAKTSGSLIAPWEGVHGWFWANKSASPVTVRLRMAGFYELIPGQAGQPAKD
jgi:hypothetical protein